MSLYSLVQCRTLALVARQAGENVAVVTGTEGRGRGGRVDGLWRSEESKREVRQIEAIQDHVALPRSGQPKKITPRARRVTACKVSKKPKVTSKQLNLINAEEWAKIPP